MSRRASCDPHAQGVVKHWAWERAIGGSRYATVCAVWAVLLAGCGVGEPVLRDVATGDPSTDSIPRMVVVPFADAKFVPVRADLPDSPEIAVLWGDPATGPSAMLMRLRSGSIPMHVHSSDYHLVVVEGTMKHWDPGESEQTAPPLGPGSYWFQPGGLRHAEACLTETCLLHIVWAGQQDARLAQ